MRPVLLAVLTIVLALPAADAEDGSARKWAVLIAGQTYRDTTAFPALAGPDRDVKGFAEVLRRHGFTADRVRVLSTEGPAADRPTGAAIANALTDGLAGPRVGADDTVVVAFVGHGLEFPDGAGYLCPADADPTDRKTLVPLADVYAWLGRCPARQKLLLVDAARTSGLGPGLRGKAVGLSRGPGGKATAVATLFAGEAGRETFEDDEAGYGYFFSTVARVWDGAATVEAALPVSALGRAVRTETEAFARLKGRAQVPTFEPATADWAVRSFGEVGRLTPVPTNKDLPVACGADGKTAVTGNALGDLAAWDVAGRKRAWGVRGWGPRVQDFLLVVGSGAADLRTAPGFAHDGPVTAVVALPGERFATAGTDGVVRVWRTGGERAVGVAGPLRVESVLDRRQSVRLLAVAADGTRLAAATSGRWVVVWDLKTGAVAGSHEVKAPGGGFPPAIDYLTFAPDGRLFVGTRDVGLVFAVADGRMTANPVPLVMPKGNSSPAVSTYTADGRSLFLGIGNQLQRWDPGKGRRAPFQDAVDASTVVGLAAAGKTRILSAHQDGIVRVWDAADEVRPLRARVRPAGPVTIDRAAFSADGRTGLLVDRAGTVRVYELPH